MSTLTARPPVVERVAGWSARHRKTTVFGWLILIIAAVVIGGMASGTKKTAYDPGEAGRAERALDASGISQQTESVLVQSKAGASFASDADFRSGVSDVAAALRAIPDSAVQVRSPLDNAKENKALVSKDGRSALVTFVIAGNKDDADKTVAQAAGDRRAGPGRASRAPGRGGRRRRRSTRRSTTSSPRACSVPSSARCRSPWSCC